jgi:hypothetical protein
MEKCRRVTEEDLLITEALIAKSYGNLKRSVIQAPSRAFMSVTQTACEHPFATAGTAVVAGAAMYGIFKMMAPRDSAHENPGREQVQKDTGRPDLMHEMLMMMIPLAAPYVTGYIQKYLGNFLSEERD